MANIQEHATVADQLRPSILKLKQTLVETIGLRVAKPRFLTTSFLRYLLER